MEIVIIYIVLGGIAGFVGGLFGVGGGVVIVPALLLVFALLGMPDSIMTHMAIATSLAAMIVTSTSSAWTHFQQKAVLVNVFAWLAVGVVIGAWLGVSLAVQVEGGVLQIAFGCFLAYVGLQMMVGFNFDGQSRLPSSPLLFVVGSIIGAISMLFGIGGGSMTVPFLSWRGVATRKAVATSAALGLPIAVLGAIFYSMKQPVAIEMPAHTMGYVYLPAFFGLAVSSIPAARIGAKLAHRLPGKYLRKGFAAFLLLISANLLWNNLAG